MVLFQHREKGVNIVVHQIKLIFVMPASHIEVPFNKEQNAGVNTTVEGLYYCKTQGTMDGDEGKGGSPKLVTCKTVKQEKQNQTNKNQTNKKPEVSTFP